MDSNNRDTPARRLSERQNAFRSVKCVSERQNAFRSVKMRFVASKCISERQNAFRSVKMHFGASKCISERQNAFRSVKMRFGASGWVGVCSASNFESPRRGKQRAAWTEGTENPVEPTAPAASGLGVQLLAKALDRLEEELLSSLLFFGAERPVAFHEYLELID